MTKVNYFEATCTNSAGDEEVETVYARSKKEVLAIAKTRGLETDLDNVRELNYKTEVINTIDLKDLFEIRNRDKEAWKQISKE